MVSGSSNRVVSRGSSWAALWEVGPQVDACLGSRHTEGGWVSFLAPLRVRITWISPISQPCLFLDSAWAQPCLCVVYVA